LRTSTVFTAHPPGGCIPRAPSRGLHLRSPLHSFCCAPPHLCGFLPPVLLPFPYPFGPSTKNPPRLSVHLPGSRRIFLPHFDVTEENVLIIPENNCHGPPETDCRGWRPDRCEAVDGPKPPATFLPSPPPPFPRPTHTLRVCRPSPPCGGSGVPQQSRRIGGFCGIAPSDGLLHGKRPRTVPKSGAKSPNRSPTPRSCHPAPPSGPVFADGPALPAAGCLAPDPGHPPPLSLCCSSPSRGHRDHRAPRGLGPKPPHPSSARAHDAHRRMFSDSVDLPAIGEDGEGAGS